MKKQRTKSALMRILNNSNLKMKFTLLFLFITLVQVNASSSYGQKNTVTMDVNGVAMSNVFQIIENQTDFHFFYNRNELNLNQKIDLNVDKKLVSDVLGKLFKNTNISYQILGNQIVLKKVDKTKVETVSAAYQKQIEGVVVDKAGLPLTGVTVTIEGTNYGTTTDFNGRFNLILKQMENF